MGQHIIPNAGREHVNHAIGHVRQLGIWHEDMVWDWGHPEGILFTDPTRSDEECAAIYEGFEPDPNWKEPLPVAIRTHLSHLRDYLNAQPGQVSNAQTVHVVQDLIRAVYFLSERLANE